MKCRKHTECNRKDITRREESTLKWVSAWAFFWHTHIYSPCLPEPMNAQPDYIVQILLWLHVWPHVPALINVMWMEMSIARYLLRQDIFFRFALSSKSVSMQSSLFPTLLSEVSGQSFHRKALPAYSHVSHVIGDAFHVSSLGVMFL